MIALLVVALPVDHWRVVVDPAQLGRILVAEQGIDVDTVSEKIVNIIRGLLEFLPIETGGWLMISASIWPCCKSFRRFQARPYCIRIWMRGWALRNATSVFGITV